MSTDSAIIIGGGIGIGYAAARRFLGRGLDVGRSGRRPERLADAQRVLAEEFPERRVEAAAADAGVEQEAHRSMAELVAAIGVPRAFVNCAGTFEAVDFVDLTEQSWRGTMQTTLDSCVYPTAAIARLMKERGSGRIILIGSTSGVLSEPGTAPYCAAKAAIHSLVRSLTVDLAGAGIQSNAVAPGWVHTELNDDFVSSADPKSLASINPMGRIGQADEVANLVEYLGLDAPDYLCGATLIIDGGQTGFAPLI
ncbi:MAG TPA: SDR family oxidoreductase [Mycobacteriales bacterium]|nr:SDR family oxidoreductase [Mycobacteriales bacterium]